MIDVDDLIARLEDRSNYQPSRNDMWQAAAALRAQRDEIARLTNVGYAYRDQMREEVKRAEWAEAERDAAMKVIEAAKAMREAGVDLSRRCIEPPYMSEKAAVNEMIGIFDGPLQRSFDAALAEFEKERGR